MQALGIYGWGLASGLGVGREQVTESLRTGAAVRERDGVRGHWAPELPPPAVPGGRRFSAWLKLNLAAAQGAVQGQALPVPERLGVIGATVYGSLGHTGSFMENMIRRNESEPQPANFIYSVHNAASTNVALACPARGYNLTVTHDHTSFEQALRIASRRLPQGQEDRLLLLGTDEWHPLLHGAMTRMGLTHARAGASSWLPGEGAAALLVGPAVPGTPHVVGVGLRRRHKTDTPEKEEQHLTQALAEAGLTWDQVTLTMVGTTPGDAFTARVFASWEKKRQLKICPYLQWTGVYPTASAAALVLGLGVVEGTWQIPEMFYKNLKKNLHRNVIILYNRSHVENRSWVILTI